MTPSPSQPRQVVLGDLCYRLRTYPEGFPRIVRLFLSPADIIWDREEYV